MNYEAMQSCIDACNRCATVCEGCASACLDEEDVQQLVRCIQLDLDCAAFCRTAAAAMSRDSEFSSDICALCADVCAACAEECSQYELDHCRECADACRECAMECRQMAALPVQGLPDEGLAAH